MIDLVRAALGPEAGRVLLVDPSLPAAAGLARCVESLVIVTPSPRRARKVEAIARKLDPARRLLVVEADLATVPFRAGSFDALVLLGGLPPELPLSRARRLVAPGGTVVLVSRVRDGVTGGAASLVSRAARSGTLPRASDLTAGMLTAGLRPVRQAAVRRSVVPVLVTWAQARGRPWEYPDARRR